MRSPIVIFLFLVISSTLCSEDYYELLGITRDSGSKDVRRAFKKLALKYHPDKNPDSGAHEKFTKINRAYEVLKDDELRKKYDLYGEDGLKDNHFSGSYQSWNFFNEEFGIYDEDKEIITLSYSDFEASVKGTEDVWFINFYSPFCNHCHEIAPIWRELARELEGVIRIGAVNCQEDWAVCQEQGIPSYPSLVCYPKMEFYSGPRTTHDMVQYILDSLEVTVHTLSTDNFDEIIIATDQDHALPWIISFCSPEEDCLGTEVVTKLAAVLANMVNVGTVDCNSESGLCELLGQTSGAVYYLPGQVHKETSTELKSLDGRELVNLALQTLENLVMLDEHSFREARWKSFRNQDYPWLIHFGLGKLDNLEMRKLPALLPEMNVGHVDCTEHPSICRDLHIRKYPAVALFKIDGYEWNHGRYTAHDIAVFARESLTSNVRTLGPDDFPQVVMATHEQWFIDFFAPWCPPCMKLLPEWRKAARTYTGKGVNFGTVDCTIHSTLCHQYGIQSYPTTIFYNNSVPHKFAGQHNSQDLVDFVETTMHPAAIVLEPDSFAKLVEGRKRGHSWIVDFYAPWCGPCNELIPEWSKLAKRMQKDASNVYVGSVDCQEHRFFCQQHGVQSYPTIRLYPYDSQGATHFHFHRGWRDAHSLFNWAFQYLPTLILDVYTHTFQQQVLENEKPWVVDFFAPWCGHCVNFAPTYAQLAKLLEGKVYTGKVNCDSEPSICTQAGVRGYPTVKLYLGSTERNVPQHIAGSMELYIAHTAEELRDIIMSEVEHRQSQLDEMKASIGEEDLDINMDSPRKKPSQEHDEF